MSASVDRAVTGTVERVDDCLVIRIACFGPHATAPRDRVKALAASLIDVAVGPSAPAPHELVIDVPGKLVFEAGR
ncbi:MAG TPA: hypothetical protein VHQ39_06815 [Dongiaceae bacterium]|jgi:hypothetical protein|nr:hypothetical protein [Dongiaceae bacterium]